MVGLKSDFIIIDPDDQLAIVKRFIKEEVKESDFYTDKPKAIVNFINKCKDDGKRATDLPISSENRIKQLIYAKYEKYLQQEHKLDFAELILLTKGLFAPPFAKPAERMRWFRTAGERTGPSRALQSKVSFHSRR